MESEEAEARASVSILDVLRVDLCARKILDYVNIADLVRSERVCTSWQRALHQYLHGSRNLGFKAFCFEHDDKYHPVLEITSRTIEIPSDRYCLSLLLETLEKWGSNIIKATIDISGLTLELDIIASCCPNLEQIEMVLNKVNRLHPLPINQVKNLKHLKKIVLFFNRFEENKHLDSAFTELFQDLNCENVTIIQSQKVRGSFLVPLNLFNLKSLSFLKCPSLRVMELLKAVDNLRTVTSLELGDCDPSMQNDVHLLLKEMPQLEELRLQYIYYSYLFHEETIQAVSGLVNLKRLYIHNTFRDSGIDDSFLDALARGCRKLEYLEIPWVEQKITARGVAALCRLSPLAVVTVHFRANNACNNFMFYKYFIDSIYKKFPPRSSKSITEKEMFDKCCGSRGLEVTYIPGNTAAQAEKGPHKKVKLVLVGR